MTSWLDRMAVALSPTGDLQGADGLVFDKFELRAPSPQNALDIFAGRWASDLSELLPGVNSGAAGHFKSDSRPGFALKHFSAPDGTLDGAVVLEIGPLEGGHAYQLERLGASRVVSVEANREAFLKCLIAKNQLHMDRTEFLLGDILEFLRQSGQVFDLIFCCGVLYHMEDPVALIEMMSRHTSRIFLWTHYHTPESHGEIQPTPVTRQGEVFEYFSRENGDRDGSRFWGGNRPTAALLRRADILRAFALFGFTEYDIHEDNLNHPNGPCFSVSLWRPGHDKPAS